MDRMETIQQSLIQVPASINGKSQKPRRRSMRGVVLCHAERPRYAFGLCKSCYRKEYQKPTPEQRERNNKNWMARYHGYYKAKHNVNTNAWRKRNAERVREYERKRRQTPEFKRYQRNQNFKYQYGLTTEQRDEIMSQNDGMCMICNQKTSTHLDHDHDSGVIRGALCHMCNKGLGHFKDDVSLMESAIRYLKRKE